MKLRFLGTGTSTGVPQIGCPCEVCRSDDPRDKRLRTSALVTTDGGEHILIDCGPDFRQQMLPLPCERLSAVLLTHEHYDHVGGMDDLRPYCHFGDIPVYGDAYTLEHINERIPYCFAAHPYPGVPRITLHEVSPTVMFSVGQTEILPLSVMHDQLPILGFRIGRLAYITDMRKLPTSTVPHLQGIGTLVVNALRPAPHHSHQSLEEALRVIEQLRPEVAYLVHMSHHMGRYADVEPTLPPHVHFAYDGLEISI